MLQSASFFLNLAALHLGGYNWLVGGNLHRDWGHKNLKSDSEKLRKFLHGNLKILIFLIW